MRALRAHFIPLTALIVLTAVSSDAWAQERTWQKANSDVAQVQQPGSFVSQFDVSDQAVTFRTNGRYAGYVLTVSGPEGFHLEQQIPAEAVPRLELRSKQGVLADGHYRIQLTAQPIIPSELAASLDEARMSGDRAVMHKALQRAGINPEEMVYATGVRVMQGRFLDPTVKETVEGSGGQEINNSGAAIDAARSLPPVLLTSASADVTDQATPEFVAGPQVKSAALNRALAAVQQDPMPEFIAARSDANAPWTRASFQNRVNGSAVALDGYLRPVVAETYGDQTLVQAYFRQADADGSGFGPWLEAYFEPTLDGGFRLVRRATVEQPATLFDYTVSEEPVAAMPDQVILDDLIVDGSICAGFDCVNGESFGFDTIRIKENNLRIRAVDTSTTASFPTRDWQITFNDSSNGGANKFSIDNIDNGKTPFTIEDGARTNALYVDDGGRIGIGTNSPVVHLHQKMGNTPTLRLEQDGTSGFTPQTWDVAGNEAGFFIRDATSGSTLPFRILPGAASQSLVIDGDDEVGIGAGTNPGASLHVKRTNNTAKVLIEETSTTAGNLQMLVLNKSSAASGGPIMRYAGATKSWDVTGSSLFSIVDPASPNNELTLNSAGNLTIEGNVITTNCPAGCGPADFVFEPDYELMSLDQLEAFVKENKHLPNIPSEKQMEEAGELDMTRFQMRLLEKIEELVLYTIEQEKTIKDLQARLAVVETKSKQ